MARQASVSLTVSAPPYIHVTYEVSLTGAWDRWSEVINTYVPVSVI